MPQSCRSEMGLATNDGLIRPKCPWTGDAPFKNDCCRDAGTAPASSAIGHNIFRQQLRSTAILTTNCHCHVN